VRRTKKPHRDHLVPLRRKHPRRRYMRPDPVSRPAAVQAKRREADRKRKIQRTVERIVGVFNVDDDGYTNAAAIRAILEDVL
jgi:hypothetical protein